MAQKRMFNKELLESDEFLSMSHSAQLLYVHMGLRADDDGFVGGANSILRMGGFCEENLSELAQKGMIIKFEGGVYVITHWHLNNYIRRDRYCPTLHTGCANMLKKDTNGMYFISSGIPMVNQMATQIRLDKNRVEERRVDKLCLPPFKTEKKAYGIKNNILLTNEEWNNIKSTVGDYQRYINALSLSDKIVSDKIVSHYQQLLNAIELERYEGEGAKRGARGMGERDVHGDTYTNRNQFNGQGARKTGGGEDSWEKKIPAVPLGLSGLWPSKT